MKAKRILSICLVLTLLLALIPSQAVLSSATKSETVISRATQVRTYVSFSGPTNYDDVDFNGCVDLQFQCIFDPTVYDELALNVDPRSGAYDGRNVVAVSQIVAIDANYFSMLDVYADDSDALVKAKASSAANYYEYRNAENIAFFPEKVIVLKTEGNGTSKKTFSTSFSTISYNPDTHTFYALLQVLADIPGYVFANPNKYNTLMHLYLQLKDGVDAEKVKINNAIRPVRADELAEGGECLSKTSFYDESLISTMMEDNGHIVNTSVEFAEEFHPRYNITFNWFGDNDEPQSATVRTIVDKLPEEPVVPTHLTGDYLYTFSGWDREVLPVTEETSYEAQYTSEFIGHDYQSEVTLEPTCTKYGVTTYTCSRCGESYTEPIDPLGHVPEVMEAVAPNCTETGLTEGSKCSRCGEILTAQETVNALGHKEGTPVFENMVAATCEEQGSYDKVVYCTVCTAEITRETVFTPILGHNWGDWVVTTDPTCLEKGEETRVCKRDATHIEKRDVNALGHNYIETVIDPTPKAGGYTIHKCDRCGDEYIDSHTPRILLYYSVPSLEGVEVTFILKTDTDQTTVTTADGKFLVNDLPEGNYRIYVTAKNALTVLISDYNTDTGAYVVNDFHLPIGDVNADAVIDIADISLLLGDGYYDSANAELDLNGDGRINVLDINIIVNEKNFAKIAVEVV